MNRSTLRMKLNKVICSIVAISTALAVCVGQFAYAANLDSDESNLVAVKEQLTSVESQISTLKSQIEELKSAKDSAHDMAEAARALGLPDSDYVIVYAKEIYASKSSEQAKAQENLNSLTAEQAKLKSEKQTLEEKISSKKVYVGQFKLTGYCPCYSCSEGWGSSTAIGVRAQEGVTVAADTSKLPLGTRIYIEGVGERVVQDVGGAVKGNKIDIFVNNHSSCYNSAYNQSSAAVYILK